MKLNLKCKIDGIIKSGGDTVIEISSTEGKVDTHILNAQKASLNGKIYLKDIIANQLKIGTIFNITIDDETIS